MRSLSTAVRVAYQEKCDELIAEMKRINHEKAAALGVLLAVRDTSAAHHRASGAVRVPTRAATSPRKVPSSTRPKPKATPAVRQPVTKRRAPRSEPSPSAHDAARAALCAGMDVRMGLKPHAGRRTVTAHGITYYGVTSPGASGSHRHASACEVSPVLRDADADALRAAMDQRMGLAEYKHETVKKGNVTLFGVLVPKASAPERAARSALTHEQRESLLARLPAELAAVARREADDDLLCGLVALESDPAQRAMDERMGLANYTRRTLTRGAVTHFGVLCPRGAQ